MKRGTGDWFFTVVELLLAAIVIISLFYIGGKFFGACTEQPVSPVLDDQGRFATALDELAKADYDDVSYVPFFSHRDDDVVLDEQNIVITLYSKDASPKPSSCGDYACVCAYHVRQQIPYNCMRLENVGACTGTLSSDVPCLRQYEGLVAAYPYEWDGIKISKTNNIFGFEVV